MTTPATPGDAPKRRIQCNNCGRFGDDEDLHGQACGLPLPTGRNCHGFLLRDRQPTHGNGDAAGSITERRYRIGDPRVQYIDVVARMGEDSCGLTFQTDGGGKMWIDWDEVLPLIKTLEQAIKDMRPDLNEQRYKDAVETLRKIRDGEPL